MLVDAAKYGDVEIPVFCYEPKLGAPGRRVPHVPGGDRGHPQAADRLLDGGQGRDGRVHPDRAREDRPALGGGVPAHQPPARLSGLRQGRRVPAAGHHLRLGRRGSRGSSSPSATSSSRSSSRRSIAIDRERCILCYRCVRFSQEVAEDYQLVLLERGAHSYVATFDGHPYVAPFAGNIVELCPVGALTSRPYRFRARPWDIEDAGLGLHALPLAVQRHPHRPRRARAACARTRQPRGRRRLAVRQGPLRLPVLPRRRARHPAAAARRRRAAAGRLGARARAGRPPACSARGRRTGALAGGDDQRGGAAPRHA